ncbi:MAG TPA: hypothetical protein VGD88_16240 [Opitutaceae bacterium]
MNESPESRPSANKVTLEELLRLKQAERPSAEFWTRFEQDFRTKQLAAAVEKRRWWYVFPQVFSGLPRLQIPLGATAILAVTFLTVREYRQPEIEPGLAPSVPVAALAAATAPASAKEAMPGIDSPVTSTSRFVVETAPTVASVAGAETESETSGWDLAALMEQRESSFELSPSARSIAANRAAAAEMEPELARFIEGQTSTLQLASTREPLAEVTSPRDARRNRLFAYEPSNSTASAGETMVVRERIASRLSEEQLYDQVRRIGGGADRLTLKF